MNNKKYLIFGIAIIAVVAFFAGMYFDNNYRGFDRPATEHITSTAMTAGEFKNFWKVWDILNEKYVNTASTTDQDRIWGAISGLASSYNDPYTVFFPPEESKLFNEEISGNFGGVGMEIGIKDEHLTVITPIKNSPAERAGVKAGDRVISIDGTDTYNLSVEKAVKLIRGDKGTSVKIVFLPKGSTKTVERLLVRDTIEIPTIESSIKGDNVFVIRLFSFTAQSSNLFRNALKEFIASGSHKIVLDLRGNPGGYLESAWDMASWFLPADKIVVTEDFGKNSEQNKVFKSKGYNIFTSNLKMIILVDAGSASASEILAGALKDHSVAKIVGTKTFGKGSVQELIQITPETSLKVTVARWLTPNGVNLSKNGIDPDYEVIVKDEDIKDGKDPQLAKALELLKD
jgi:carboxyl-terminal processing protease